MTFMRCSINDGTSASFWFDTWTLLGLLISVLGQNGPQMLRIRKCAMVSEASGNGSWLLPPARSPEGETLQIVLTTMSPLAPDKGKDRAGSTCGHQMLETKRVMSEKK
ncbi:hypothetical protein YC2023_075739 [Brassica napus]